MRHSFRLIICPIVVFLWVLMPLLARAEVNIQGLFTNPTFHPTADIIL